MRKKLLFIFITVLLCSTVTAQMPDSVSIKDVQAMIADLSRYQYLWIESQRKYDSLCDLDKILCSHFDTLDADSCVLDIIHICMFLDRNKILTFSDASLFLTDSLYNKKQKP